MSVTMAAVLFGRGSVEMILFIWTCVCVCIRGALTTHGWYEGRVRTAAIGVDKEKLVSPLSGVK